MKKYLMVVNGGSVEIDGRNVLVEEEIKKWIIERGGGKDGDYGLEDSLEGEDISLEELWNVMEKGGMVKLIDGELCERGDDWVEFELFEVKL